MSITQLPPAPSRTDPATFSTRADTFVAALPTFVTEANATAANVTARENQIEASAAAAASSEAAAAASENQALEYRNEAVAASGAVLWVAGTSYAIGDGVVSPTNFKSYRDKVGGVSNTDPANDLARWLILEVSRLEAIAATKAVTAVDVFVYDTSKDSDGGAWRKRCQHTSWYNEPLNTATRGARREFPAVALIVAEAAKITIYDADDPALPMWRVEPYAGSSIKALAALNAAIWVATTVGLIFSDYAGDDLGTTEPDYTTETTPAIINNAVKDVAMTVLPNAPIDPATGLPVPTIAVATAAGVSVIKDDGTVADSLSVQTIINFSIGDSGVFYSTGNSGQEFRYATFSDITSGDGFGDLIANIGGGTSSSRFELVTRTNHSTAKGSTLFIGGQAAAGTTSNGVGIYQTDTSDFNRTMTAVIKSTYNTGWMVGNIKGAFLSDTDDTDLVGGNDADRSVNANPLTVNGTITRTPVATGADLVGYSGFSETNYLEGTDATYADTLYALGWEQTAGVWEFKHGFVSAAPIDGLTITGTTLKIAGTKPKALVRVTATTPTASQLAKIQADEKVLFQDGAQATLFGASDAVTALAHDPVTDLLHVGTSAGRSVFQGLRRVSNTTTAVGTAISASNGLVVEE